VELKICKTCNVEKEISHFHKKTIKNKNTTRITHRATCKPCRVIERAQRYSTGKEAEAIYQKSYRLLYPERRKKTENNNMRRRRANFRNFLNEKKNRPCLDCDQLFPPCAMDFDHRDRATKKFNVSEAGDKPSKDLLEEIEKCDVVCANCHRKREFDRRGIKDGAHQRKVYKLIASFKTGNCLHCNKNYGSYSMDLDHRDPKTKCFSLGKPPSKVSLILEEIAKCDLVCANCHRIKTFTNNAMD
jgi:hypothetical protein